MATLILGSAPNTLFVECSGQCFMTFFGDTNVPAFTLSNERNCGKANCELTGATSHLIQAQNSGVLTVQIIHTTRPSEYKIRIRTRSENRVPTSYAVPFMNQMQFANAQNGDKVVTPSHYYLQGTSGTISLMLSSEQLCMMSGVGAVGHTEWVDVEYAMSLTSAMCPENEMFNRIALLSCGMVVDDEDLQEYSDSPPLWHSMTCSQLVRLRRTNAASFKHKVDCEGVTQLANSNFGVLYGNQNAVAAIQDTLHPAQCFRVCDPFVNANTNPGAIPNDFWGYDGLGQPSARRECACAKAAPRTRNRNTFMTTLFAAPPTRSRTR